MKIGASLVLLVAPTVIACAAAVPVGVGRAYKNAHTTNPNGVFRKRASPLRSNARNLRISGCASNFDRAQAAGSCSCAFGASPNHDPGRASKHRLETGFEDRARLLAGPRNLLGIANPA